MVIYSKEGIVKTTHEELLKGGFSYIGTGTLIEFYIKDNQPNIYYHTKFKTFFKTINNEEILKIIVAGGRDFIDYNLLKITLDKALRKRTANEIQIISGGAKGADKLGEQYAKEKGYNLKIFPADWNNLGNAAGPIRNIKMAEYATHCLCFWDERSRGTYHMINTAKKYGLKLQVINY